MWLTVKEYADKVGKTVQMVYMDIRLNKISKENVERRPNPGKIIYIRYEEGENRIGSETQKETLETL